MKISKFVFSFCVAIAIPFSFAISANAIVYTLSNETDGNRVIAFDINKLQGTVEEIGSFPTGGTGSGAPLGNQAALTTDASDRWLFATNAGDGSITSFRLQEDGLEFVNKVYSGGHSAISVAVYGTLVYVLNEGSGDKFDPPNERYDTISGFRFGANGVLEPLHNSTRILNDEQLTAPAQIGFNKSGTVLLITEKATNMLTTYVVKSSGLAASEPLKRSSAVPTPFGFAFGDRDYVFITEANGGSQGVTASYRIDRTSGEVSSLVDLIEQGDASCWTVLTNNEEIGYSINTGSGSVSPYRINFDGTIEPFSRFNPNAQVPTGAGPRDAVLTQDNNFFFTLNNGDGEIRMFRVSGSNRLVGQGTAPIPTSATGLMAR